MSFRKTLALTAVVFALLSATASAELILDLKAANYNPSTGIWADSSGKGNNATQGTAGSRPSLAAGKTLNGSSAVYFDGVDDFLTLANSIAGNHDFTMFAYWMPTKSDSTIVGGGYSGLQWWTSCNMGGRQVLDSRGVNQSGYGASAVSTTAFSLVDVQASVSAGAFRLNQADSGTNSGWNHITNPATTVGEAPADSSHGWGPDQLLKGYLCELRIYNDVTVDRPTVEQAMLATYTATTPEPSTLALLAAGLAGLLAYAWRKRR